VQEMKDDLFSYSSEKHRRNTDPSTSRESAKAAKSFVNGHARMALDALEQLGPSTQSEIADKCGLLPHQVNKRLSDLQEHGRICPTGRTRPGHANRQEREWMMGRPGERVHRTGL